MELPSLIVRLPAFSSTDACANTKLDPSASFAVPRLINRVLVASVPPDIANIPPAGIVVIPAPPKVALGTSVKLLTDSATVFVTVPVIVSAAVVDAYAAAVVPMPRLPSTVNDGVSDDVAGQLIPATAELFPLARSTAARDGAVDMQT